MTDSADEHVHEKLRGQREALADFGLLAFRSEDIDELLHRATELVAEALDVRFAKVLEHIPDRGLLLIRSGVNWEPGVVGHETFQDHEMSPGGYALRTDEPVISPDIDLEERFETPDVLRRHGVRSMVNVIIAGDGTPFGVLEVDAETPRNFTEDDVVFLRSYANLLAASIERVRTHADLRSSAREQHVLANELGHRVRNLLGLVRALAAQTSTDGRTAEEFRDTFLDRLQALSKAEGLVFDSGRELADLSTLAQDVLAPHRQDRPERIFIEGQAIGLSQRQARMFGLALHELATNATKHGALSVVDGTVRISWSVHRLDADGSRLSLTWQEADGPDVTPPQRKGFGSRLLEDVVAHELDGEAQLVYRQSGLVYRISFPVSEDR
ncbi:MAG: sensor histidine kinase [Salinarimonas sp.]